MGSGGGTGEALGTVTALQAQALLCTGRGAPRGGGPVPSHGQPPHSGLRGPGPGQLTPLGARARCAAFHFCLMGLLHKLAFPGSIVP